jgi:ArsR family transcriptional regulator
MSKSQSILYRLSSTKADDLAKIFAALSHPHRIRMLRNIAKKGTVGFASDKKGPGCSITDAGLGLAIGLPTLSHHIKELKTAGLIRVERHGQVRMCWITTGAIGEMTTFFLSLGPRGTLSKKDLESLERKSKD